ncbi:hypothetical protein [Gilliamella sp. Pas-s25]|uniref:hypothetical protein n=1 Tax=Gilliamella sp. Pas-s25 TaxID=2687310 RepID=UPI00135DBEA7|nr:hypothetical protein [Gilliamella sp. Pas-s25]MWP63182.1 hypothetical protein [Gilliamella sp. Pas-s25]
MLLLSFSWNSLALTGKSGRGGHRSDAIILPSSQWGILKSVKPNLDYGELHFAGPADIWNPNYGFLVQSTDAASYALNFPTTGADGLYFDFIIMGEAGELTWGAPVTHEGITATVTRKTECNDEGYVEFRVTLTGPEARAKWGDPYPNQITVPRLPQAFELVGRDREGKEIVRYGFVLQKWFVNRGAELYYYPDMVTWCSRLGYRVPQVKDLTNAICSGLGSGSHCQGSIGATPPSSGNHYQRQIGAGLFTEWGFMHHYTGADFVLQNYWTSDTTRTGQFDVGADNGDIYWFSASIINYGLCTAP